MTPSAPSRTRRGLLVGSVSAALGAAAVALGQTRAEAASAPALLLGRGNDAGARSTGLTATTTRAAWALVQRGTGGGLSVSSAANAVAAAVGLGNAWAVWARNAATRTGTGGALRVEGRRNAGLLADTTVQDVPAVVAVGGDGTGVAQVATGQSYLDGDALALRAWTGVIGADGTRIAYAPVVSAEDAAHVATGTATLDATGALVVPLPTTFTAACDMTVLAVTVTPVGAPMPGLFVTYRPLAGAADGSLDGFTVAGGAPAGTVAWAAWSTRRAVDLRRTGAAALSTQPPDGAGAAAPERAQQPSQRVARRLSRSSLRIPAR